MSTFLPRDDDSTPIPALRLRDGGAQMLTLSATSSRTAVAFSPKTRVIAVTASAGTFIRTGDAGVTAAITDHYLPANTYLYLSLGDDRQGAHSHLAAIEGDGGGTLYISEME